MIESDVLVFALAALVQAIAIGLLVTKGNLRVRFEMEFALRKDKELTHPLAKVDAE